MDVVPTLYETFGVAISARFVSPTAASASGASYKVGHTNETSQSINHSNGSTCYPTHASIRRYELLTVVCAPVAGRADATI